MSQENTHESEASLIDSEFEANLDYRVKYCLCVYDGDILY